jgi:hypothetical protein
MQLGDALGTVLEKTNQIDQTLSRTLATNEKLLECKILRLETLALLPPSLAHELLAS